MDKNQEKNLRALKTGPQAKKFVLNGGIKAMNSGMAKTGDAQRSAIANLAMGKGVNGYSGVQKEFAFDAERSDMANLMAANGWTAYNGNLKKFDQEKAAEIVKAVDKEVIQASLVKEAQDRKMRN